MNDPLKGFFTPTSAVRGFSCSWCHHRINWWARFFNLAFHTKDGFGPLCFKCYREHKTRAIPQKAD